MMYQIVAIVVLVTMPTVHNQDVPSNNENIAKLNSNMLDTMDYNLHERNLDLKNEINQNPDTCAQLNQVQSVVIQLLGSHFEYGKTMEILTSLSDSVQTDILDIKSRIGHLHTSQINLDEQVNLLALSQSNLTEILTDLNEINNSNSSLEYSGEIISNQRKLVLRTSLHTVSSNDLEIKLNNLSKTVEHQSKVIVDYERQMRRIRRSLTRVEAKLDHVVSARHNETLERSMVTHFMQKQKDINGNMLASIRYLETHLKQMLQQDSPQMQSNGCPSNFVRHFMSCYRFLNTTLNWVDAEKHCQALHLRSHLIGLQTPQEEQFIIQFRNYNNAAWTSMYIWTGATDMGKESMWSWVGTNQELTYTNWRPGQPDNHNNNWSNCIYMRTHGQDNQWDDWHCHAARINFVCEINLQA